MAKLKLSYPIFRHAASVTCGSGSLRSLAGWDDLPGSLFLTSGRGEIITALTEVLDRAGIQLGPDNHLIKPPGEPTEESVALAGSFISARKAQRIVAIGGGSVLDWARLGWAAGNQLLDPATGRLNPVQDILRPQICLLPTTCGTGAEAADVAVYQSGGRKMAVVTPAFMADQVILDGNLLKGLPEEKMAQFVCDALSHALEASLSIVPMRLGKEAALSALRLLLSAWAMAPGPSRRDALLEGSFLGGVAAANCSVGLVHAFAHAIGTDGVGHGQGNAFGLIGGLRFNAQSEQMSGFLRRAGYDSLSELELQLQPIVGTAMAELDANSPLCRLSQSDYRADLAERMLADVAIRTNPRRPADQAEVEQWLNSLQADQATS